MKEAFSNLWPKTDNVGNCSFVMSSAPDLNYFSQTCEPFSSSEDPHTADFVADVERLRGNIKTEQES
jgi:hypothetical protein